MLHKKRILLGITGSIAAYKSALLARELQRRGAEVRVVMSEAATEFITPLTLATLTDHRVYSDFTESKEQGTWTNHVNLGLWADVFLIAPATAQTLSSMVQGAGDSFLLAVHLSSRSPVVVAPAMDLDMFKHPATQENLKILAQRGVGIIEPESGPLASGLEGKGRMAEPEHIADWMESWFAASAPLYGKKVLITAGPTHEPIDAVRFIGNRSSGKMGYALADAFIRLGAQVTVISGPVQLFEPEGVHDLVNVQTAQEMYDAALQRFESMDIAVAAAAVADARPVTPSDKKLHKDELPKAIELESTRDILAAWGQQKAPHQTVVGFALETDEGTTSALSKLERKNADFIVLNSTSVAGAGFETDTNQVTIFEKGGNSFKFELKSKAEVANDIVRTLLNSIDS
ncbi:MAG: bifunctional phosphopantothenoylcysteine decarboxylase/phosphopantothenate--cysteine ligase CoaBC [Crocinitomicaceae bacterium]|nr:bifunctional phosphopantothenoylcysteine decarboxylase/phosphopantothenate--cysteine ligase CoaBC [Crocinitomicaceae bacterium]